MNEEQLDFPQIFPDENKILDRAIELRKENYKLSVVDALGKAFEESETTKKDHDQMYYRLMAKVGQEERRRRYEAARPDLHD